MTEKEFRSIITPGRYHILVFTSPAMLYACFARHPRIVLIDDKGTIDRFEIKREKTKEQIGYSHFYHNRLPPREGLWWIKDKGGPRTHSKLVWHLEGDKDSQVKEMFDIIKKNIDVYPYKDTYRLYPGPNSNTFIQWILDKVPEWEISLPWNCIGKKYK